MIASALVQLFFAGVLVLFAVELWLARARAAAFRWDDAIANVMLNMLSRTATLAWGALLLAPYVALYRHRVCTMPSTVGWVVAFVGIDFLYYWFHRLSHRVSVLWAAHVVHHQSEQMNVSVAIRGGVLEHWTAMPFYLPLALAGVPPLVLVTTKALAIAYQAWIHTELVGKLGGPWARLLNLPQHHRVHHAINPGYLDKNYGLVSIVWDRLFGTWADEVERPIYGTTDPVRSLNPIRVQLHTLGRLLHRARAATRWRDRIVVWFAPPGWRPAGCAAIAPSSLPPSSEPRSTPAFAAVGCLLVIAVVLCLVSADLPPVAFAVTASVIVAACYAIGVRLDDARSRLSRDSMKLSSSRRSEL